VAGENPFDGVRDLAHVLDDGAILVLKADEIGFDVQPSVLGGV